MSVVVLHETLLVPVLMYDSEPMFWKKEERIRIRAVQIDNLRGFLGTRRIYKLPNVRIRLLCGVKKGIDERLVKSFFGGSAMGRGWLKVRFPRY